MSVIGLHVFGETLRVAEVERSGEQVRVVRMQALTLPAASAASPATKGMSRRNNGDARPECIAALPPQDVLTRTWSLPQVDGPRARLLVGHRLEADLPISMEQLVWSFRSASKQSDGQRLVLAQAARRDRATEHMARLSAVEFTADAVTTEHEALGGLIRYGLKLGAEDSCGALILESSSQWLVAVIDGGLVRAIRRIPCLAEQTEFAGRELQQTLIAELGTGRSIQIWWCAAEMDGSRMAAVAGAHDRSVVPVEFPNLRDASGRPLAPHEIVEFGPAIGLALAGLLDRAALLRLAGEERKAAHGRHEKLHRLLAHPWRLTAAACGLLIAAAGAHVGALRWETKRMSRVLGAATVAASPDLERKIQSMKRLEQYRVNVEDFMSEVCKAIPPEVIVSSVQLSREHRLVIKATSKDPKAAFTLADALRKSSRFAAVNPERAAPSGGGDFTVSAELVGIEKLTGAGAKGARWR